jgi:hypothetical protein
MVGLDQSETTSLRGIAKRAQACKDHRFQNLYRLLDANLLLACWEDLNKKAASGVDGVTAAAYEQDLIAHILDLVERLRTKRYRTRLVRRCTIPKENGGERPLGIPALEDKLVQSACAKILGAIYEANLGFELYWARDRRGDLRVMKRTARKKLQQAKRRMKRWIRANRHLPGRQFIKVLNRKLVDHYNYVSIRSNGDSVNSFYHYTIGCSFKWLNRRGGKKSSFTWAAFKVALKSWDWQCPGLLRGRGSMRSLYDRAPVAKASTTEKPDAGKLHVWVCAGGGVR